MAWRIYFMRYERYLRRSTTTARSPIACTRASRTPTSRCRRACSAWSAATSAPRASCSRSTPSRASTRWCSSRRRTGSARPSCRARSIRTSSTSTSRNLAAGRPAILRKIARRQGACKMVFADAARAGHSTRTVDVAEARSPALLDHRRRGRGARALSRSPSRSTTAGRWTSSGAATASTASSTSCRRGPRR